MQLHKFAILFFTALCISFVNVHAQKNLIENSGFENELEGWSNYGPIATPWVVKSGKKSCAIITYDKSKWVGTDQAVFIPKKTDSLQVSAWAKAENIAQGKDAWNAGLLSVQFLDIGDKNLGDGISLFNISGTTEWQLFTKQIKVPAGAKKIKVMLAMSYASGSLFADDVTCTVAK